jgi:hypothetical protein
LVGLPVAATQATHSKNNSKKMNNSEKKKEDITS